MVVYNISFMDNSTNIVQVMTGIGASTGNSFLMGYMILLSFFLIFLVLTMRHGFNEVLIIDGFLSTLIAILLFFVGLIPAGAIAYPMVIMVIAILLFLFMR